MLFSSSSYAGDIKNGMFKILFNIIFPREKNSLSCAEFHALSNDTIEKKVTCTFYTQSEAFLTKTWIFSIKSYFEYLYDTFSYSLRASKSVVKTYVVYVTFDARSIDIRNLNFVSLHLGKESFSRTI